MAGSIFATRRAGSTDPSAAITAVPAATATNMVGVIAMVTSPEAVTEQDLGGEGRGGPDQVAQRRDEAGLGQDGAPQLM